MKRVSVVGAITMTSLLTSRAISSVTIPKIHSSSISYVDATIARRIDEELMSTSGFTIDQLMELAGLAVATAAMDIIITSNPTHLTNKVLIACGPGNNGGDGLVAARHLHHFGLLPTVIYPKENNNILFVNLIQQCKELHIPILSAIPNTLNDYSLIIDALFGFSFNGPTREPFTDIINKLSSTFSPSVLSVDLPSGWDVEKGDIYNTHFKPQAVISLTLPKQCMKSYSGNHYIGGRFVPPRVAEMFQLRMPNYGFGSNQIVRVNDDDDNNNDDELCTSK